MIFVFGLLTFLCGCMLLMASVAGESPRYKTKAPSAAVIAFAEKWGTVCFFAGIGLMVTSCLIFLWRHLP